MSHLNSEDLIAYVEGRLADWAMHGAKEHLQNCGSCAEEVREWAGLFEIIRSTQLQNPPEQSVRNCLAIFRPEPVENYGTYLLNSFLTASVNH